MEGKVLIIITKEQMDYLAAKGVDIHEPLARDDLQGVLDTIDDEIVCLVQNCYEKEIKTVGKLQKIWDDIFYAN